MLRTHMILPAVIIVLVAGAFLTFQLAGWRKAPRLPGMTPSFAKWTIAIAFSSLIAYATARLTSNSHEPLFVRTALFQLSWWWLMLSAPCVFILFVLECVLLIELAFARKRELALISWHAGAVCASASCLGAWNVFGK